MFDVTFKKCCQALRGKHEKKSFAVVWCTHDTSWQHSRALSAVEDQIVNADILKRCTQCNIKARCWLHCGIWDYLLGFGCDAESACLSRNTFCWKHAVIIQRTLSVTGLISKPLSPPRVWRQNKSRQHSSIGAIVLWLHSHIPPPSSPG